MSASHESKSHRPYRKHSGGDAKTPQQLHRLPVYAKLDKYEHESSSPDDDDDAEYDVVSRRSCLRQKLDDLIEDRECLSCVLMSLFTLIVVVWFLFFSSMFNGDPSRQFNTCSGRSCQEEVCAKVLNNEIVGNLCMDLCFKRDLELPKCGLDLIRSSNTSYQFYKQFKYESLFVCPKALTDSSQTLKPGITLGEFEQMLKDFIQQRLNHSRTVERIVERILYFTDSNHDFKLNYPEAATLWSLLNTKHTFYILMFGEKAFIPSINDFCGSFIEIEEIIDSLSLSESNSLLSVFSSSKWTSLKWEYRLKISLGILEFFLDAAAFNPNDEFGPDALHLCAPIADSFGYTFFMEAKLLAYDQLLNGRELARRLGAVRCASDADCVYTAECGTRCVAQRCSAQLARPPLAAYCAFLRDFLADQAEVSAALAPAIARCLRLDAFHLRAQLAYAPSQMPLSYEAHRDFIERADFWNKSIDYSVLVDTLKRTMWQYIRLVEDPKRKKKT